MHEYTMHEYTCACTHVIVWVCVRGVCVLTRAFNHMLIQLNVCVCAFPCLQFFIFIHTRVAVIAIWSIRIPFSLFFCGFALSFALSCWYTFRVCCCFLWAIFLWEQLFCWRADSWSEFVVWLPPSCPSSIGWSLAGKFDFVCFIVTQELMWTNLIDYST